MTEKATMTDPILDNADLEKFLRIWLKNIKVFNKEEISGTIPRYGTALVIYLILYYKIIYY